MTSSVRAGDCLTNGWSCCAEGSNPDRGNIASRRSILYNDLPPPNIASTGNSKVPLVKQ